MAEPNDAYENRIPVHVHLEVDNDSGRCSPPLAITSRAMIQQLDDVPNIPAGINDGTARLIQTVNTSLLLLQQSHDTDQLLETLRQLQLCLGHDNCKCHCTYQVGSNLKWRSFIFCKKAT